MTCPECGAQAYVIDTRENPNYRRRRYECNNGHRFNTAEVHWETLKQIRRANEILESWRRIKKIVEESK